MTRVRLLPEAEEELWVAARFYEQLQSGLGLALLRQVRRATQRILERPQASRIERGDIRVRSILRFPCHICPGDGDPIAAEHLARERNQTLSSEACSIIKSVMLIFLA
jgi:hypothetical protein